jgi:hypothetical protein
LKALLEPVAENHKKTIKKAKEKALAQGLLINQIVPENPNKKFFN